MCSCFLLTWKRFPLNLWLGKSSWHLDKFSAYYDHSMSGSNIVTSIKRVQTEVALFRAAKTIGSMSTG